MSLPQTTCRRAADAVGTGGARAGWPVGVRWGADPAGAGGGTAAGQASASSKIAGLGLVGCGDRLVRLAGWCGPAGLRSHTGICGCGGRPSSSLTAGSGGSRARTAFTDGHHEFAGEVAAGVAVACEGLVEAAGGLCRHRRGRSWRRLGRQGALGRWWAAWRGGGCHAGGAGSDARRTGVLARRGSHRPGDPLGA